MTDQDVADYLGQNPDFFTRHPELFATLQVPRGDDKVTHLAHHALQSLRSQLSKAHAENARMIDSARANAWIFERTRGLVLALLQCEDLDAVSACLEEHLQRAFELETVKLVLVTDQAEESQRGIVRLVSREQWNTYELDEVSSAPDGRVGRFSQSVNTGLFGQDEMGSAAAVPVGHPVMGVLALGSADQTHFDGGMDTLFLSTIAEALGLLLPRVTLA